MVDGLTMSQKTTFELKDLDEQTIKDNVWEFLKCQLEGAKIWVWPFLNEFEKRMSSSDQL